MSELYPVEMRANAAVSSRGDKALFLAVFLVGTALILWQKIILRSAWVPMATGAALILIYCWIATSVERFRIRDDRVGEGAYYLGFLFTLVSLSVALYEFNRGGTDVELISRFGLSLATTIVGIVCRVVLQQLREAPDEAEEGVRESLANVVLRLEAELRSSVEYMTALRRRVEQETAMAIGSGMREIIDANKRHFADVAKDVKNQIDLALSGVSTVISDTQATATKSREVSARLFTAMEGLSERIGNSQSPVDVIRPDLEELVLQTRKVIASEKKRAESHGAAVESLVSAHKEVVAQTRAAVEMMKEASAAAEKLSVALQGAERALTGTRGHLVGISEVAAEAKSGLVELVATTKKQVADSGAALLEVQRQVVSAATTIAREVGGR
jgi:hypothetical protein